jgi:broad specificity phosphatase PhoE
VQADALGTVFAADPPSIVLSSDLSRARDTAAAVSQHVGLPLHLDERLRETHFGQWQGMTHPEIAERWPAELEAWRSWRGHAVGGEAPVEVAARARAAVEQWLPELPDGGALLAVTHGGTARALVGTLTELPPDTWWRLAPLGNTCWSTLVEDDRGWRLERHNTGLGPLLGAPTGAG